MNKLLFAAAGILVCFSACKKEKSHYMSDFDVLAAMNTPKLQRSWTFDGYTYQVNHPSGGARTENTTYYTDLAKGIDVHNDTTITIDGRTLICRNIDSTAGLMTFTPALDNRDAKNFVKFYYKKDSIAYMFHQSGVSMTITTELHTK